MSNSELFHIKDDKEELSNLEVLKIPKLMIQKKNHEIISISSTTSNSHSNDHQEKDDDEQEEQRPQSRIVLSKHQYSDSEADTTILSREHHNKVEDEEEDNDGFRTPTQLDQRIPVAKQCPLAPSKPKPSLKRRKPQYYCPYSCKNPLDLSKEVELLFPSSSQSTKKVRRE